jgi:hypothetical protein
VPEGAVAKRSSQRSGERSLQKAIDGNGVVDAPLPSRRWREANGYSTLRQRTPVAELVVAGLPIREGIEAWRGDVEPPVGVSTSTTTSDVSLTGCDGLGYSARSLRGRSAIHRPHLRHRNAAPSWRACTLRRGSLLPQQEHLMRVSASTGIHRVDDLFRCGHT